MTGAPAPLIACGLGNPLLRDEGIGIRLVRSLSERAAGIPRTRIEFRDLGTAGFALLHALADRQIAVIIDCAFMGLEPGTMKRFRPADARSRRPPGIEAGHQGDVLRILTLLETLGQAPEQVILYGIEPKDIRPGTALSPELESRMDEYLEILRRDLTALAADGRAPGEP